MRALVLAACLATGAAACFTPIEGSECRSDGDCAGATCTRIGECAESPYALRVSWTLHGEAANVAGACTGVSELEIQIADPSLDKAYAVRPVPCTTGSFFYDKLPLGYTDVVVTAFDSRGNFLTATRGTAVGANGLVSLDLSF